MYINRLEHFLDLNFKIDVSNRSTYQIDKGIHSQNPF